MTVNPPIYTIRDRKKKQCRKCGTTLQQGDTVRRQQYKNAAGHYGHSTYLCRNCYVDAHGDPIIETA